MSLFLERTESPRERAAREAFEKATANDPTIPDSLKSKEQLKRQRARAKEQARMRDYRQKEQTLAYKRERLAWQKERSKKKDEREALRGSKSGQDSKQQISYKDKDPTAYQKMIGNVASGLGSVAKVGAEAVKDALKRRKEQKRAKDEFTHRMSREMNKKLLPPARPSIKGRLPSSRPPSGLLPSSNGQRARKDPAFKKREIERRGGSVTEQFSCWKEELLYELGDIRRNKKIKSRDDGNYVVDVMRGKNKITIGPTIKETHLYERKRDHLTNSLLGAAFISNVIQSPEALLKSGHIEGPGMQLMSRMMQKRKEADRNLDSGRVSHPARNKKIVKLKENLNKKELLKLIVKNLVDEKKRKNYLLNYGYIGEESKKDSMKCNKPQRAPKGAKQKYIVKACDGGREGIVRFGFRGMQDFLQHKDEKRRANFKARHRCSEKTDKLTPGWWACNYNW